MISIFFYDFHYYVSFIEEKCFYVTIEFWGLFLCDKDIIIFNGLFLNSFNTNAYSKVFNSYTFCTTYYLT